jgi:hypothetical protein
MEDRSDTSISDSWLEHALARWEWEGGHVASDVKGRITGPGRKADTNHPAAVEPRRH